jgi:hypothetical protein
MMRHIINVKEILTLVSPNLRVSAIELGEREFGQHIFISPLTICSRGLMWRVGLITVISSPSRWWWLVLWMYGLLRTVWHRMNRHLFLILLPYMLQCQFCHCLACNLKLLGEKRLIP